MIQNDMLYKPSFEYIKKERFTGSYQGLRYSLQKKVNDDENNKGEVILACAWPEPLCFEKTDELLKHFMEFDFSKEGLNEAWDWLSNKQEEICNQAK